MLEIGELLIHREFVIFEFGASLMALCFHCYQSSLLFRIGKWKFISPFSFYALACSWIGRIMCAGRFEELDLMNLISLSEN